MLALKQYTITLIKVIDTIYTECRFIQWTHITLESISKSFTQCTIQYLRSIALSPSTLAQGRIYLDVKNREKPWGSHGMI